MKLLLVAGARPNFMKIAPIIRAHRQINQRDQIDERNQVDYLVIHTGQHYDYEMSQAFFEDLEIPKPDYFLGVGSESHAVQTARIMIAFEEVCLKEKPEIVVVVGDVNSTIACALVAKKLGIGVAHVEAGLRSRDLSMPEEINRMVTDTLSDWFFVSDLTLHRPSNVDPEDKLREIMGAVLEIGRDLPVYFPVHPRTRGRMEAIGLVKECNGYQVNLLPPLSYRSFLSLCKDARLVLTDSGGLQEETTALGIPCFTIRENTERPITIEEGTNTLVGTTAKGILSAFEKFKNGVSKKGRIPELWDGHTSERIIGILLNFKG